MTATDTATSAAVQRAGARARCPRAWSGCRLPAAVTPSMSGQLPGRHLDADAGQEPDQHGAGQEIRQEPRRPGRPGPAAASPLASSAASPRPAGRTAWRPGHRQPGQRGGQDRRAVAPSPPPPPGDATSPGTANTAIGRSLQRVQAGAPPASQRSSRAPRTSWDAQAGGQWHRPAASVGTPRDRSIGSTPRQQSPEAPPQPSPPAAPWEPGIASTPAPPASALWLRSSSRRPNVQRGHGPVCRVATPTTRARPVAPARELRMA